MATQTTGGGSTTSFTNTPQAKDDTYTYLEDLLRSDSTIYNVATNTVTLDVMSNDLGGNAKALFSVEDGDGNALTADFDLLVKDVNAAGVSAWECTLNHNWVRINNGKIEYRIADGSGIPGQGRSVDSLTDGQNFNDQFVYAIRLGNGTLSEATVKIHITGAQDAASIAIVGTSDNSVTEAGGIANSNAGDPLAGGTIKVSDADFGQDHFQTPSAGSLNGTYGNFTFDPNSGVWTYTLLNGDSDTQGLKQGQAAIETLTVTSADGSASYIITVNITGTNDAPVAVADVAASTENQTILVDVVANDTDVDSDHVLSLVSAAAPAGKGSASVVGGKLQFAPGTAFDHLAQGVTETVVVNYTMQDEYGATSSATLTITVTGTNDGPVAVADTTSMTENQTILVDVLANDTDVDDGHSFTLVSAAAPAGKGSASVVGNQLQFNPGTAFDHLAQGATETVVINYTMQDEHGATSSSTLSVTITGTNDGPVAVADSASITENQTIPVDVLANDTDVDDGHSFTLVSAAAPAGKGSASIVAGQVQFAPGTDFDHLAQGATEIVVVNYTMQDEHGATSSSTLTITITGTNDGPVAVADTASMTENQTILVDVLANDTDVDDGHSFTLSSVGVPANQGSVSIVSNQLQFNPGTDFDHLAQGATAVVVVNYTMQDEHGATSSSTVTITVTGTNDGPVAHADTGAGTENQVLAIDVLANDTDVDDGHSFTLLSATAPATKGSASVVGNQLQFDPGTDFDHLAQGASEIVVVNYTMQDEHGAMASSTLTITVTGTNDTPIAVADSDSVFEDASVSGSVGATDADDGAVLSYALTGAPPVGLTFNSDGSYSFDASSYDGLAQGEPLVLTIPFTATDEHLATSAPANLTITITGTNDAPTVSDVAVTTVVEDGPAVGGSFSGDDVDSDDSGASLTYAITSAPSEGSVVNNNDGTFSFDPGSDFQDLADGETRQVTFTYTGTDGHSAVSNSGTVTVTVTGTNDAPEISIVGGDSDGDTIPETNAGLTTSGTLTVTDADTSNVVDTAVTGVTLDGDYGSLTSGDVLGMLTLSGDVDLAANSGASNNLGWAFDSGLQAFDFLAAGQSLTLTYQLTSTDDEGATDTQDVTITITGTNDDPVLSASLTNATFTDTANNDSFSAVSGTLSTADPDSGDTATYSVAGGAPDASLLGYDHSAASAYGTLYLNSSSGAYRFVPNDSGIEALKTDDSASFTLTVTDSQGASDSETLTINIDGANDTPELSASLAAHTYVDTSGDDSFSAVSGSLTSTDRDAPESATYSVAGGVPNISLAGYDHSAASAYGTLYLNGSTGAYTFVPNDGAIEALKTDDSASFTLTVTDGSGATDSETLTINLDGANDTPELGAVTDASYNDTAADDSFADVTGTLTSSDRDAPESATYSVAGGVASVEPGFDLEATSAYGTLYLDSASGAYKFVPDDAAIEGLKTTDQVDFAVTVTDGSGASDGDTLTITLNGVNDTPDAPATNNVTTDEDTASSAVAIGASDRDAGETLTYSVKTGAEPAIGSVSFNQAAGTFTYTPAPDANGPDSFTILVTDASGATTEQIVSVTVNPVNDNPVAADDSASTNEDTPLNLSAASLLGNDSDVDVATNGQVLSISAVTNGAHGTAVVNLDGSITYTPNADYNGTDTITYTVSDGNGGTDTADVTITVNPVNDAPANTLPVSFTTNEDTSVQLSGLSVADLDAGSGTVSVTLGVASGSLTASSGGGIGVSGSGTGSLVLSGTLADLNAYLASASSPTYVPVANANGAVTLTMTVNDGGNSGAGGPLSDTDTSTINITAVNDAPAGADNSKTIAEDGSFVFATADFGFSDSIDGDGFAGVKITTLPTDGTLLLSGVAVTAGQFVSFVDLAVGNLRFVPDANENGTPYASFTFQVQDTGGTANGGVDLDQSPNTITFNVTAVNDAPVIGHVNGGGSISALDNVSFVEDNPGSPGQSPIHLDLGATATVSDIDSANFDGGTLTVAISVGAVPAEDILFLDTSGNVSVAGNQVFVSGILIGTYTGGTAGNPFVVTFNANATPALVQDLIHALVYDNNSQEPTQGDRFYDLTLTDGDGGSTNVGLHKISVFATNDAPSGTNATLTATEDTAYHFTAGNFGFSDVDGDSLLAVKITTLPTNGTLLLNGGAVSAGQFVSVADINAGLLTFTAAPNANGNAYASLTFQVQDNGGTNNGAGAPNTGVDLDQSANTITFNVTAVNDAPVITSNGGGASAAVNVAENSTAVTTVTSSDVDGPSATYAIVGGADALLFAINPTTGVLSFVSAPNFEAPADAGANNVYDVIVQASDGSLVDTQAIAVTVTNVNETPTITSNGGGNSAAVSVAENSTAVTTVVATDPDAGTTIIYSIQGGADSAKFTIDASTGALSFVAAPNYESPTDVGANNVFDVIVRASDGALFDDQSIAVTVTDVNAPPVITSNGGAALAVNVAENSTAVTTITATDDGENTGTLTYSLSGADASKFTITAGGVLTFVTAPNFESPTDAGGNNVYDLIVTASDGTLTDTQAIAVTVTDVNAPPTITSNGGAPLAVNVAENSIAVTTITATDDGENTGTLTYSLSGADAAKFTITAGGVLSFISAPNFESPTDAGGNNVYDLIVTASDGTLTDTQAIAVTVTNVNETPTITSNGGGASAAINVAENSTAVTTVIATDPDAGTTLTYSIQGGADSAKFTINSSTGALSFNSAPNFEAPTDSGANNVYDVIVRASDGTLFDDQAIAVTVTDVSENVAPVANSDVLWVSNSTTVTLPTGVLMANDIDPDGLAETITGIVVSSGSLASPVTLNADGTFSFTTGVAGGTVGAPTVVTLTYTTSDGAGGTSTGTVTVNIVTVAPGTTVDNVDLSGVGTYAASYIDGRGGADNLTDGGGYSVMIGGTGNGADTLIGNAGNDLLIGGDGNDTLSGGAGNDILRGGVGSNDSMDGGLGTEDLLDFSDGTVAITFTLDQTAGSHAIANATGGLGNNDTYQNMEGVIGTSLDDTITGSNTANDILRGGGGNDTLNGAGGTGDLIDFRDGTAGITFTLTQSGVGTAFNASGAGLGTDTYSNMEGVIGTDFADNLTGSSGNDILRGEGGNDTISGGLGNDTITGGAGADNLTGGGGNDTFVFGVPLNNVDTITDYSNVAGNADIIDITQILSVPTGTNVVTGGYVRVTTTGLVQVDTNGGGDNWATIANVNAAGSYTIQYVLNGSPTTVSVTPVAPPIGIDMDGDGHVSFLAANAGATFDYGYGKVATAWVAGNDGILVRDANHDGQASASEIVFATSGSDLQGLAVYDSNHDGQLSSADAAFADFDVWQDANSNGVVDNGEMHSLTALGIASISLSSDGIGYSAAGGDVSVVGTGSYTRTDGSTGVLADAVFNTGAAAQPDQNRLTASNSNAALIGAIAAAGLAASEPLAAASVHSDEHAGPNAAATLAEHAADLSPIAATAVEKLQAAEQMGSSSDQQAPAGADGGHAAADASNAQLDSSASQPAAAPAELLSGSDTPAHAQIVGAMPLAMPSGQQLAGDAADAGSAQHNQIVGQVLADALDGGGGQGADLDALLASLPDHGMGEGSNALATLASYSASPVMGFGLLAADFGAPHFSLETHVDAAPPA